MASAVSSTSCGKDFLQSIVTAISTARQHMLQKITQLFSCACLKQEPVREEREEVILQRKWATTSLDPEIALLDPDCAQFLLNTKLAYWLASYSRPLCPDVGIRVNEGVVELMVDEEFISFTEFTERFAYDKIRECMIEREAPRRALSCIAPALGGFVFKDQYAELFPVAELSEAEYQALRDHAGPDSGNFFQIYTSPWMDSNLDTEEDNLNLAESLPGHFGLRIIMNDRKVYSFSLRVDRDDKMTATTAALTVGGTVAMDFDEPRKHDGRLVTTLPISQELQERLVEYINEHREQKFNFLQANCAQFAATLLQEVGHRVELLRAPEAVLLESIGAHICRWPSVGPGLYRFFSTVNKINSAIGRMLPWFIKAPLSGAFWLIERALNVAFSVTLNIPRVFVRNSIFALLGGTKASQKVRERFPDDNSLPVLNSLTDLFSDDLTKMAYSKDLIAWMRRQPTTILHPYVKPEMTIVSATRVLAARAVAA